MILEIRVYKLKPGLRDKFAAFFDSRLGPAQQAAGMQIPGQFVSTEDDDTFVWLRAFDREEDRMKLRDAFYEGPIWRDELADEAMAMIESFSDMVVASTPGSAMR